MSVLKVRIGARGSKLSKAQTSIVSKMLSEHDKGVELEYIPVKTRGDRIGPNAGPKGAFTEDIETLLLEGKIDIAIHSMKDLTSEETEGLAIGATPPRGDPRDALVSNGKTLRSLPKNAKVGTSSLRRKAQLLRLRPDLRVVELHGNVDSRLKKVGGGAEVDAIVLAAAGLQRIGEGSKISQTFSIDEMVPAVCQGTIAVQMREDDRDIRRLLSLIDDPISGIESRCERAFASRLGVDCNVPVGGYAWVSGPTIKIAGMLAEEDGSGLRRKTLEAPRAQGASLGERLADELLGGRDQ